jgi:ADP-heptose:LPS heptosyltransferase
VPALRGLRRAFPRHRLVLATTGWLAPVVELIGGIDDLVAVPGLDEDLPCRAGEVDVAVNLHGSGTRSRDLVDALDARLTIAHRVAGRVDGPGMPAWREDLHERERWVRLVGAFGVTADPLDLRIAAPRREPLRPAATVIHVGSAYGSRRWPAERFVDVGAALAAAGHDVVFTGDASERPRAREIAAAAGQDESRVLAGRTSLAELAALIASARLVVSADTGAAHLASAYRRPSVVLFGPAPVAEWGPPPGPHVALTEERLRLGDAFSPEPDPALLAVTPAQVLAAARRVLGGASGLGPSGAPGFGRHAPMAR